VGAHSSRCGQRGGKQDISRAASSSSQQSRHRTNSPPHALKIFLCFVNHQSISIHNCSGGLSVWDTLPCLHTGVSYPGAFISQEPCRPKPPGNLRNLQENLSRNSKERIVSRYTWKFREWKPDRRRGSKNLVHSLFKIGASSTEWIPAGRPSHRYFVG
jgi:hypothetical protein